MPAILIEWREDGRRHAQVVETVIGYAAASLCKAYNIQLLKIDPVLQSDADQIAANAMTMGKGEFKI